MDAAVHADRVLETFFVTAAFAIHAGRTVKPEPAGATDAAARAEPAMVQVFATNLPVYVCHIV